MNEIYNISTLQELCKYDALIRRTAYDICRQDCIADDLVNDFYLKVDKVFKNGRVVNGGFVGISLRNAYTNYLKGQNKLDFGFDDTDHHIPDKVDDYYEVLEQKINNEEYYQVIFERIDTLNWYEMKILECWLIKPLTELAADTGISYKSLYYSLNKIKIKIGIKNDKKETDKRCN